MQNRRRYRFHDQPINMHHPHRAHELAPACSCAKPKPATTTQPAEDDDYVTLAQEARRRPITTAMINRLNRAFRRTR